MKKILILTLSCDLPPYDALQRTQEETWDSIDHPQCETVYYFSNKNKENSGKYIYFPIPESLYSMGHKLLAAFEWALANKDFNYIARPHSCIYVNKNELAGYINELPDTNVCAGPLVVATPSWLWGGLGFVFSRDVVQKIVDNKTRYDHRMMEDVGVSSLVASLGIPFTEGTGCSIDKYGNSWLCLSYGSKRSKSFTFTDFADVPIKSNQFYYRVKQDYDRNQDMFIMRELFKHLQ
jgi:hypothetical protein